MNKFVAIGVLILFGFLAYGVGKFISNDKNTSSLSMFKEGQENVFEGKDVPQRDPDIRGRIVSIAEDHIILSQSTLETTFTEEERTARRESMQTMSDAEREALRTERTADRSADTKQVRIGFADSVRFLEDTGESTEVISWEDIQESANMSIWTQENTTDQAIVVLVRQRPSY
jgi:hypothetical protein